MTNGGSLRPALLAPCFWPEVRRGGERFVRDLADGLIARGQEPTLITSHPGRPTRTVEDALPIIRNWRPPPDRLERRHFEHHMTHVPFSYLSLMRGEYDLAQAMYSTDALAAARWGRKRGRPTIFSYLGIPTHAGLTWRRRQLEFSLRAVNETDVTVSLSHAAAHEFKRWLGVDTRVIHPGVDIDVFSPGGERSPEPTIVCAATLDAPRKRVDMLARAFAQVRRERPEARLLLNRPRDPALAEPVSGPGIEFVDLDERSALVSAYRSAWVSALPSTGEAFGLVLTEALACGTPVVATRVGGMSEIVDSDEVGRLFDGEEPELARALLEALELSGSNGTAAACRARAQDYSAGRTVEEYIALYRELLERYS